MVELEKILSERSDERILKAVMEISETEFTKLVESVLGYLELKTTKSRPKGSFIIAECIHRPDGKKYVVFFSRRPDTIVKVDIESLISYMARAESPNGLVLTTGSIDREGANLAEKNDVGLADGAKLAALLRRFDLDKEVVRAAEAWKERAKVVSVPGADKRLEEAMRLGYESLAARDFMKALDEFDHSIMLKEDYDVPWRLKGNTLDEMGYHEQALECYKHALELHPESDETWFSLGSCLFSLGRYSEEIICYDRALQYNPNMQKALVNKGSTLHRLGRFKEALETYDKVLKINYRLEKVHNNRGATLHSLGQMNEALAAYNRAIELKHDYVEALMNKGGLLYELGRYGEAFEDFGQITHLRPELPKGWYLRGLAARKTGNTSAAKASFEAALRLDPDYTDARRSLEEISRKIQEKFTEVPRIVQDIFASEAAKAPEAPPAAVPKVSEDVVARVREEGVEQLAEELYGDRAEILMLFGRFDEAFDFLGKSLRLEGENAALLTRAGNVLYEQGKFEAAARTYEHALVSDPSCESAMFNLHTTLLDSNEMERATKVSGLLRGSSFGWAALTSASLEALGRGDFKQALDDVERAIALEDIAALENYKGLARLAAGDLDGAAETFLRTRDMSLDQSEAHNNLGAAYLKKGEQELMRNTETDMFEKASFEIDKAIKYERTNPAAWNNRGCVLYKLDRYREAIACFDESLLLLRAPTAMSNRGFSQLSLDLLGDALSSFEESAKIGETAEAFNNKGIVLERMGRHEDAMVAFREALKIAPTFKDAADNMRRVGTKPGAKVDTKEGKAREAPPPGEEVIVDRNTATKMLAQVDEAYLREKRKTELEAMCEALDLDPKGTRADLIVRILKAKRQLTK